jgi:hypothetical protein
MNSQTKFSILIQVIFIIVYLILLIMAFVLINNFYICDDQTCKAFTDAGKDAQPGTKEYVLNLLQNTFNDGVWMFAYIGASIIALLSLWFADTIINVKKFAILFLTSFLVIYALFAFFGHHYLSFITSYVYDYVENT